MECRPLLSVSVIQDRFKSIWASPGKSAEIETGMAEKSSPGTSQTDGKNLVWFGEIERKFAKFQYLPLLIVLPLNYFMVLSQHFWPTRHQLGEEEHQCSHIIVILVQSTCILYRILLSLSIERVVLHNERFCNGCITKRCLHNLKMGLIMTSHDSTMVEDESNKNVMFFVLFWIILVILWRETL